MFGSLHEGRVDKVVSAFNRILNEDTRKEILNYADPRIKARVKAQGITCRYQGMTAEGRMRWKVKSGTIPGHWWNVWMQFKNIDQAIELLLIEDQSMLDLKITRALINGDLEVHCNCSAWLYWGFQYRATKRGYAIKAEDRKPERNLAYAGSSCCKHVCAALQTLPFLATTIVGQLRMIGKLGNRSKRKGNSNGKRDQEN